MERAAERAERAAETEAAQRAAEETAERHAAEERWQEWMMEATARRTMDLRAEVVDGRWRWWVGQTGRAVEDAGSEAEVWMGRAAAEAVAAGAEADRVAAAAARWRAAAEWGAALAPRAAEDMAATLEWEAGMAAVEAEEARGRTITGRLWIGEVERRMDEMAAQLCLVGNSVEWAVGEWRAAETREEAWAEEAREAEEAAWAAEEGMFEAVNQAAEDADVWKEERAEEQRLRRTNQMLRAAVREAGARAVACERAEAAAVERAAETERRAEAVEMGAEQTAMLKFQVLMANWRQM